MALRRRTAKKIKRSAPGGRAGARTGGGREQQRSVKRNTGLRNAHNESSWNEVIYSRETMNMDDPAERREFVNACLEQIAEAQLEMDNLEYEYRTVTAYLHDLEEIDHLPAPQREEIARLAQKILDAGRGRKEFYNRDVKMSDADFERIHELEPKTGETIKRMADAEDYRKKITNDLRRLDSERNAYDYRLDEIDRTVATSKTLLVFTAVLTCGILILLFALGRVFKLNVTYGYMLAVLFAALAAVMLTIRAQNASGERKTVTNGISRLILLQNTVKIRYVNNQNLLNYMSIKYHVKNSEELRRLKELYDKEVEDRAKLRGSEKTMMEAQRALLSTLRNYRLQYPEVWMKHLSGLANPGDEVEIRHELIGQRQSLRERMDYNERKVKGRAREEIERLARDYPEYADEVLDMVMRVT